MVTYFLKYKKITETKRLEKGLPEMDKICVPIFCFSLPFPLFFFFCNTLPIFPNFLDLVGGVSDESTPPCSPPGSTRPISLYG